MRHPDRKIHQDRKIMSEGNRSSTTEHVSPLIVDGNYLELGRCDGCTAYYTKIQWTKFLWGARLHSI